MRLSVPFGLALAIGLAAGAFAAELRVPQDYTKIQAAIDASANDDVVLVAPGIYREALDFRGRRITLRSTAGASVTFLDGTGLQTSIVTVRNRETRATRIEGFSFRNGYGNVDVACNLNGRKGGAIFALSSGLTIVDCVFESPQPNVARGGAIFGCSADLAISNTRFERNAASHGGAIYWIGLSTRSLTVARSTFRGNESSFGGAISSYMTQNSSLSVSDSTFDGNDGDGSGGAISIDAIGAARIAIDGSSFTDNHGSHGGSFFVTLQSSAQASVTNCQFSGGTAAFGGALNVNASEDGTLDVSGCDFRNLEAGFGGGIFAIARGNPPEDPGGRIRINASRFFDNVAHPCCNAGLIMDSCVVDGDGDPRGNGLHFGGGVDLRTLTGGTITVGNSLFVGNSALRGGGLHAGSCAGGAIDVVNCTIVDNSSGLQIRLGAPKLAGSAAPGSVSVANSILRENDEQQISIEHEYAPSSAAVTFSDVEGGFSGVGNLDVPPSFVDPAARDYRLAPGSACIDAGDNAAVDAAVTEDLDGRPRLADDPKTRDRGTRTAPQVDLGAYEFQPETPPRRRAARPK